MRKPFPIIAAVALLSTSQVANAVVSYLFDSVYTTSTGLPAWTFLAEPTIADTGAIAFRDADDPALLGLQRDRIRRVDGNTITTLFEQSFGPRNPRISENGVHVLFQVEGPTGRLFRASQGSLLVEIAEESTVSVPGSLNFCNLFCDVANDGSATFSASFPLGIQALLTGTGGAVDVFADTTDLLFDGFHSFSTNNVGTRIATADFNLFGNTGELVIVNTGDFSNPPTVLFNTDNGPLAQVRGASITDNDIVAFLGRDDDGVDVVYVNNPSTGLLRVADSSGPIDFMRDLSVNELGEVVFVAGFDGAFGQPVILAGGDAVADRVVGYGDVVGGKTVTGADVGPYGGINNHGEMTVALQFSDGTNGIFRITPFVAFVPGIKRLLSTGTGGSAGFAQSVELPPDFFDVALDLDFLAGDGFLRVLLGDHIVGRFSSDMGGEIRLEDLDPADFGRPGEDILLSLLLDGLPGTTVQLDNIFLAGLSNGDFELGLEGWGTIAEGGGTAFARVVADAAAPAPATLPLFIGALGLLGITRKGALFHKDPLANPSTRDWDGRRARSRSTATRC